MSSLWGKIVSGIDTLLGPSSATEEQQGHDPLAVADARDQKTIDAERRRETTKRQLRDVIAKLQQQEVELCKARDVHMAEATRHRAAKRMEEAKTAFQRASLYKTRLTKNRANQCAATKRLLDIDSMEVDGLLISAFRDTSKFMRESNKDSVRPEQVQDIMLDLTEQQAEQEMVSEIISTATDMGDDTGEQDVDAWLKETAEVPSSSHEVTDRTPVERKGDKRNKGKGKAREYEQLRAIADDM